MYNNDSISFKQAKVCFHKAKALVLKQMGLKQKMRAAHKETEVLLCEI